MQICVYNVMCFFAIKTDYYLFISFYFKLRPKLADKSAAYKFGNERDNFVIGIELTVVNLVLEPIVHFTDESKYQYH